MRSRTDHVGGPMSTRSTRVTDCYPQPLTREQKRPDVPNREFFPVNDFVICDYADVSHGDDCEEFVVAKAPHPFDGMTAAGSEAPAGTLALPKGTHVVAHSGDAFEIELDGTEMVAIRATDIVGVILNKPAAAPAQAAVSSPQPKPSAGHTSNVIDMAAFRDAIRDQLARMPSFGMDGENGWRVDRVAVH
jgi:hypothetical protein